MAASHPPSIDVPGAVRWIVRTLEENGFETWTVGGAVRDALAGRPSGDWDLATRAPPEEVRRVFRRTVPVGIDHGTIGVLARDGTLYEVTTFRKDVETFGRHAVVAFAQTLAEDLHRRDFTINAVAWHPLRRELFDPHDGAGDLERGILRTVGNPRDRFAEDYLRVLRALRFAGRFRLQVDPGTWTALGEATAHLDVLSPERVREELWKVLEGDPTPSRALELYRESGALEAVVPEVAAATSGGATRAWTRTLAVVDALPARRGALRMAALLADVGRPPIREGDPPLPPDAGPAASPIRLRGMVRSAALLTRLRHSNARVAEISALVGAGPELPGSGEADETRRRWLARVGPGRMPDLVRWAGARARIEGDPGEVARAARALRETLAAGSPLTVGDLAISGRDLIGLGLKPGPHFGVILEALLDRVLADPGANEEERLRSWALELAEAHRD